MGKINYYGVLEYPGFLLVYLSLRAAAKQSPDNEPDNEVDEIASSPPVGGSSQ
jgi:hypothetical protein